MVQNNAISFGANIKTTQYLNDALSLTIGRHTDEVSLTDRAAFVNALQMIKNDASIDTFEINEVPGTQIASKQARPAYIAINGVPQKMLNGQAGTLIYDGYQCIQHVINFANDRYGEINNSLSKKCLDLQEKTHALCDEMGQRVLDITNNKAADVLYRSTVAEQKATQMMFLA